MHVELLDRKMVDSDLGVVNAARCSFDKESQWICPDYTVNKDCMYFNKPPCEKCSISEKDKKLIRYLAQHNHWTPFAHAQEVFSMFLTSEERLDFFFEANLAGFEWSTYSQNPLRIRGSLYAWLTNMPYLPQHIGGKIWDILALKYPVSTDVLMGGVKEIDIRTGPVWQDSESSDEELVPYTLRITCPIFVKRQLETHRRNFVMTDIEDFSQNEVSRRYVDTDPEFYVPTWRMQSASAKQGSSEEEVPALDKYMITSNYTHHMELSRAMYQNANALGIAHEQSRLFLPLSTYTTFWWTGSLKSWRRMFGLRREADAQKEVQHLAELCYTAIQPLT